MEKKLDISGRLDFSDIDFTPPEEVIVEVLNQISDETMGIVLGKVDPYNGHVVSYTQAGISSIRLTLESERKVNIQESLGKIGEETHKFECYLYTPEYDKYKYRVFFVKYDTSNYPVSIILEETVARSVFGSHSDYIVSCDTREALEELMIKVFTSKKLISVMQELIRINQSKKATRNHENAYSPE